MEANFARLVPLALLESGQTTLTAKQTFIATAMEFMACLTISFVARRTTSSYLNSNFIFSCINNDFNY